jgi:hypothetical protein|tara:strand:- start:267 stop:806 length:540 start_codon:yes stop_codon:yes gene_type:complete
MNSTIKINNIFPNFIATKKLNISKLKVVGKNFQDTFESRVQTTLDGKTLLSTESMNYLNIELTNLLSHILKPMCKTFIFNMIGMWINKYNDNNYQGAHVHPSDFSFIIYYKTNKSHTVFNSPVKKLLESSNNEIFDKYYEPDCKQGDIIIFPSYLEHWVKPNSNNTTIAGNIKIIELKK